ncbi:MAG: endonuclease/exonuclease/phosphatase family protein [Campylobacterota bacterium]|nr:endonuclease/exonuclease/phosphatase family protein [Campylobacterota bacterium]
MKNKFKIATFNLWKDEGKFPSRIYKIPEYLEKLDCICFQEDFSSEEFCSSDTINEVLQLEKTTLPIRKKDRNGVVSSSNLTILSKLKPNNIEKLIYDENGEDERGALLVEITFNDKNILIVNTHLTNLDQKKRIEQIYKIKNTLDKKEADLIILCGDMNSLPSSEELQCIKRHGFIDYNNNPTYEEGLTLDYILSKGNFDYKVKSKIVVRNLSDHFCLQNSFKF